LLIAGVSVDTILRLKIIAAELATIAFELGEELSKLTSRPRLILVKSEEAFKLAEGDGAAFRGEAGKECHHAGIIFEFDEGGPK